MSTQTPRNRHDGSETTRLDDLLRADAAAVVDDDLDDEASYQERPSTKGSVGGTEVVAQRPRSQVYSVRVPVEQLGQLRRLAKDRGTAPTAMLRDWVLARLESEISSATSPEGTPSETGDHSNQDERETPADRLEGVATLLADLTVQLTKMLATCTEVIATSRTPVVQPFGNIHMLPTYPGALAARAFHAYSDSSALPGLWAIRPEVIHGSSTPSINYILKGLTDLRSTVADASIHQGFSVLGLDAMYRDADDELSYP